MTAGADHMRLSGLSAGALAAALIVTAAFDGVTVLAESAPPHPSPPVAAIGATIETLDLSRGSGAYPVFASVDLHAGSTTARQALVIIHGRLRNAADYYATGLALTEAAGAAGEATVVVAPQFLNEQDASANHISDRILRWNDDWGEGAPAKSSASSSDAPSASSYDVLDDVVAKLSNAAAFPALKRVVFVGHGGGAQMLARYAVVMRPQVGAAVRFVIANAGTYLYPTTARPLPVLDCPDFNLWKYGLDKPPPYVRNAGAILKDFAARDITLLLGASDKKASGILDQSCAAKTQGHNRLERGRNFAQAMTASGLAPRLKHAIVADTGHDERGMLLSHQAGGAIFASGDLAR